MKKYIVWMCVGVFPLISFLSLEKLSKYEKFLREGTYANDDWGSFERIPASRYETFKIAFEHFEKTNGRVIVELGTSRSYVHGGLPGCNSNDTRYWTPGQPQNWDWGAGFFTRVAAECLQHCKPTFYTVDIAAEHMNRCKHMTGPFKEIMHYCVYSSVDFLKQHEGKIDLLYIDTGDMTPIEPTALLQLEEARIIVERDLMSTKGMIVIDDVRNQTPKKYGDTSGLGKAKYSLPYFLTRGF